MHHGVENSNQKSHTQDQRIATIVSIVLGYQGQDYQKSTHKNITSINEDLPADYSLVHRQIRANLVN